MCHGIDSLDDGVGAMDVEAGASGTGRRTQVSKRVSERAEKGRARDGERCCILSSTLLHLLNLSSIEGAYLTWRRLHLEQDMSEQTA